MGYIKNKSRIASFYDIKSLQAGIANDRLHAILELIGPHQDKSILYIGCGKGHLLKHLTGQYKVGVDISIEALNVAKNYCDKTCVLNIDEDGLSIFPDESFDIIVMTKLLEHLFFPEFALKEAHRALKMGGS